MDEIEQNNWSLVPSRYIEFVDRDTEINFDAALKDAGVKVHELLEKQESNRVSLEKAFRVLGYGKQI